MKRTLKRSSKKKSKRRTRRNRKIKKGGGRKPSFAAPPLLQEVLKRQQEQQVAAAQEHRKLVTAGDFVKKEAPNLYFQLTSRDPGGLVANLTPGARGERQMEQLMLLVKEELIEKQAKFEKRLNGFIEEADDERLEMVKELEEIEERANAAEEKVKELEGLVTGGTHSPTPDKKPVWWEEVEQELGREYPWRDGPGPSNDALPDIIEELLNKIAKQKSVDEPISIEGKNFKKGQRISYKTPKNQGSRRWLGIIVGINPHDQSHLLEVFNQYGKIVPLNGKYMNVIRPEPISPGQERKLNEIWRNTTQDMKDLK